MDIDTATLSADAAYKLLTGSIVPRPIAWVTTLSENGLVNAAPFSAFTFVSNKPPMIGISIGRKQGKLKDTARNILRTSEFVVNIATEALLEKLHQSADEYPEDISEIEELAIETGSSQTIGIPRIASAPICFECKLAQVIEFGDVGSKFFVGRIEMFRVRDDLIENGKIETRRLQPIARLGGPNYASLGDVISLRPVKVSAK